MRFEVPQFIEVEDKIVGPLTWRQFIYLSGGVGIALGAFFYLPLILFAFIGLPFAILGGALAFYPVNNRNFSFFLEALVNYFRNQRLYLWRRNEGVIYKKNVAEESESPYSKYPIAGASNGPSAKPKKSISSLTRKLELQALQKSEQ